ncbi:pantoate--beta-alanine ligase [Rhizobium lemnae]|uniref:Pantothenate synthetase n=1 Tax=Rhizobium lemnae TaxID=1214924 RepID=A0ABV8EAC4_9HYPH|nr:pantoate--beta-alanine ligase [Rhizobium lemnae]MCJ8506812.1 pantoate--beta-alanine ligase [Rhizobium lemnae]
MQIIKTREELRAAVRDLRADGRRIGFVPTMGYLHVGHMTLVERSQAENGATVVSIFVNPLQFGKNEDLDKYPRDLARDCAMLEAAGVDILFAPDVSEMYPSPMLTVVDVPTIGSQLEGEVRPGHFAGVATVVTKLFNLVQPDAAYFGEKDYQQVQIIRRMVEDLAQPVQVVPVATVREPDGLACSSRNVYLTSDERKAAVIVPRALDLAERLVREGLKDPVALEAELTAFLKREPLAEPDVVAVRHATTLQRVADLSDEAVVVALFVRFGTTRLLDNRVIAPVSRAEDTH